mgnify:CR=1 FL=1|jgi:release factor glutamine methyltransferase
MEVYQPAEDSYLLADFLKKYFKENIVESYLDMGTGSGILAEVGINAGIKTVVAADINPEAVKMAKEKGAKGVITNLFENIKEEFSIISFNAPYLPLDPREPVESRVATTGGIKGDEITIRFLKEAVKHLNKDGKIFLLVSSLTPMDRIKNFNPVVVEKKRVFGEDLLVLEISN